MDQELLDSLITLTQHAIPVQVLMEQEGGLCQTLADLFKATTAELVSSEVTE